MAAQEDDVIEDDGTTNISDYERHCREAAIIFDEEMREAEVKRISRDRSIPVGVVRANVKALHKEARAAVQEEQGPPPIVARLNQSWFKYRTPTGTVYVDHSSGKLRILRRGDFDDEVEQFTPKAGEMYRASAHGVVVAELALDHRLPPWSITGHTFNLWRGFAVEPLAGDAMPFMRYVEEVWADDPNYVLDWCAACVQNPTDRSGTALFIDGPQGAGKSTLGWLMCKIFGRHGLHIQSERELLGAHNTLLEAVLMLWGDEITFAGNKAGADLLKSLITAPTVHINPKGVNAYIVPNGMSMVLTSNHSHAAHVEAGQRRLAMYEAPATRKGDTDYWTVFYEWLETGGFGIVLQYLLNRDVRMWHAERDLPHTEAEAANVAASAFGANVTHAWLLACRAAGHYLDGNSPATALPTAGGRVLKTSIYSAFQRWNREQMHAREVVDAIFWKQMRGIMGKDRSARDQYEPGKERSWRYDLPAVSDLGTWLK